MTTVPAAARAPGLGLQVAIVCGLIQISDGFDLATVGMTVPLLVKQWGLPPAAFANAFVLSSVGILFGALIAGPVGDRFGRKPALIVSAVLIAVFSLLTARVTDVSSLVLLRFLTGLGLGAALPLTVSLTSQYAPAHRVPTYVMFMFAGNTAGGFVGGQVASLILPQLGWQGVYLFGGVLPLLTIPLLWWLIPPRLEPAVATLGRARVPFATIVSGLFGHGMAPRTLLIWAAFLINLLNMYLMIYWLPTVLSLSGFTAPDAAFAASMLNAGGVACLFLYGPLADRFGPQRVLLFVLPFGALFVGSIGWIDMSHGVELAAIFGAGAAMIGGQHLLNATATLAYPQEIRATGVGAALGVGRLGGIVGPALGGLLLAQGVPPRQIFESICGTALLVTLVVFLLTRLMRRNSMDAETFLPGTGNLVPGSGVT